MLAPERHAIILSEIERHPVISIRELTSLLGVSRETIRKDIELLAAQNKLGQVRGGAVRVQTKEAPFADRKQTNAAGKRRIAAHVAAQIPDGASVIIDMGSTTLPVAEALEKSHKDLIIYTNDMSIAEVLAPVAAELVLLGGRVVASEMATLGVETLANLSRYRAEYVVISVGGLSARALFTNFSRESAEMHRLMIAQAETPLVLVDSSKYGVIGQVVLDPLPENVDVISDKTPPADIAAALESNGITVTVVP